MLFDTHTHVNFPEFDEDRDEVLRACSEQNIWITNVGCDYKSSKAAVDLAEKFETGVYATVGQHPTDSTEDFNESKYEDLITPKVVAIGECGLDYYHKETTVEYQKNLFEKQIIFAQKTSLPLVIHCRDNPGSVRAYEDVLDMLSDYSGIGIIHSFTESWEIAENFLVKGFFVAFNAILIFAASQARRASLSAAERDKASQLIEVAKNLPSDRILTETDAPFLSPIKGKRNEPGNVLKVAEKIAELRGEDLEKVSEYTFNNGLKIYGIRS